MPYPHKVVPLFLLHSAVGLLLASLFVSPLWGQSSSPAQDSAQDLLALRDIQERLSALENSSGPSVEVGGQYRVLASAGNFGFHDATIPGDSESRSFVNQRFRTHMTVRTDENVQGHIEIEMGHIVWGDDFESTKTFSGPRTPASTDPNGDRVGVEVRRAWLGFGAAGGDWRVGIQDRQDAFGQTLFSSDWDFNAGGVTYEYVTPEGPKVSAGALALWEGDTSAADDAWLLALDIDDALNDRTDIGASVYYVGDGGAYSYPEIGTYEDAWDLWFGIRAQHEREAGTLSGQLVLNTGEREDGPSEFEHTGVMARVEASGIDLLGGDLDVQALWATGGDPADESSDSFRTVAQSARDGFGAQGYWSYLAITSPHGPSDVADLGVGPQNRGLGLLTVQARHRLPLTKRMDATTAAGWLASDVRNPTSGAADMGVEVAETLGLDLGGGLRLDFGAAYLFTGDFYAEAPGAATDNLWQAFCRLQLEF